MIADKLTLQLFRALISTIGVQTTSSPSNSLTAVTAPSSTSNETPPLGRLLTIAATASVPSSSRWGNRIDDNPWSYNKNKSVFQVDVPRGPLIHSSYPRRY